MDLILDESNPEGQNLTQFRKHLSHLGLNYTRANICMGIYYGWSSKEIADAMCMKEKTVKENLRQIYMILKVKNRYKLQVLLIVELEKLKRSKNV